MIASLTDANARVLKVISVAAALMLTAACASTTDTAADGAGDTTPVVSQPAGPAPGSVEDFTVNVQDRVFFAFDRYDLNADSRGVLERQAAWLKLYPTTTVTIEGHADERGTREYNFALGARRANAVRDYLISLGIDPARVRTISYGKERPTCSQSVESCWSLNRRGVSVVNAAGAGM